MTLSNNVLEYEAAFALLDSLTNSGIKAFWFDKLKLNVGTIVVTVGKRPDKYDTELLESLVPQQLWRDDLKYMENELKKQTADH